MADGEKCKRVGEVADAVLAWYDAEGRDLPWRQGKDEKPDPYAVWLSEIMLQQTTVKAAIPFYLKFLDLWPDIGALARAELDDVMRAWAGLGYYSRAQNMHRTALIVANDMAGRFPENEEGLLALPGIGSYTAAAIAAIAFGHPATVVDANVERVVARLYAVTAQLPGAKSELKSHARDLMSIQRPGDYAQAMMDLGAVLCTPKRPSCSRCPLAGTCQGLARGIADTLPLKSAKSEKSRRRGNAFFALRADDSVLLRRRPDKGLLGAMMEVPSAGWSGEELAAKVRGTEAAPFAGSWRKLLPAVRNNFTHFHLELDVYFLALPEELIHAPDAPGDWRWVARRDLAGEALPSVMRKVVSLALRELQDTAP